MCCRLHTDQTVTVRTWAVLGRTVVFLRSSDTQPALLSDLIAYHAILQARKNGSFCFSLATVSVTVM